MIKSAAQVYFLASVLSLHQPYSANFIESTTSSTSVRIARNTAHKFVKTPYLSSVRFHTSGSPVIHDKALFSGKISLKHTPVLDIKTSSTFSLLPVPFNRTYTVSSPINDLEFSGSISLPETKNNEKRRSFWSNIFQPLGFGFVGAAYSFANDTYNYVKDQDETVRKLIEDIQTDIVENQTRTSNRSEQAPQKVVDLRNRQLKIEAALKTSQIIRNKLIIGCIRECLLRLTFHNSILQITNELEVSKYANLMLLKYKMNDFSGAQEEYIKLQKALEKKLERPFDRYPNTKDTFPASFKSACHNLGGLSYLTIPGAVNEDQDPISEAYLFRYLENTSDLTKSFEAFKSALSNDPKNYQARANLALLYLFFYNHLNFLCEDLPTQSPELFRYKLSESSLFLGKLKEVKNEDDNLIINGNDYKNYRDECKKNAKKHLDLALEHGLKDPSVLNMCAFYIQCCEEEKHWLEACMYYDACPQSVTSNYYTGRLFMKLSQRSLKDKELKSYFMTRARIALAQSYKETPAEHGKIWSLYKVLSLSNNSLPKEYTDAVKELSIDKIPEKAQMKYLAAILNSLNGHDLIPSENTEKSKSVSPIFKRGQWFDYMYPLFSDGTLKREYYR
jgi:hypothetical protein